MKYLNEKTGVVIETTSELSGGDWHELVPAEVVKEKPVKKESKK